MKAKRFPAEKLTLLALLVALRVVLGDLVQISLLDRQFNLGFLAVVIAAALMGIPGGLIVGALGDVLGTLLFPAGAFFPGFTLTAALVGVMYALPLYPMKTGIVRVIIAICLAALVNLLLNSLWISMLYTKNGYWACLVGRAPTYLIEAPLQIAVSYLSLKALGRVKLPGMTKSFHEVGK